MAIETRSWSIDTIDGETIIHSQDSIARKWNYFNCKYLNIYKIISALFQLFQGNQRNTNE